MFSNMHTPKKSLKKVKMLAQTMKWLQVKETGPCHGPDAE